MEPVLLLNDKKYELIKVQRENISAIYKCGDEYLRIGREDKIERDLETHRKMERAGFPIAKILEEGTFQDMSYFVETSVGEITAGKLFTQDVAESGTISDVHFDAFLAVVEKFAQAQLHTKVDVVDFETFAKGIHLDILCKELPQHSEKIQAVFSDIKGRLSSFPFVLTHGDFNPHNIYPAGVIDFEDSFYGPFGYDIISALVHINYFPDSQDYEYFAKYHFSSNQRQKYLDAVDTISQKAGLQKISDYTADFEFCRAIWHLVRMHEWPKLQQFRYDLFIEKFLK